MKDKVIEIMKNILKEDVQADEKTEMANLGFSSISFVKLVTEVEEEYGIEFEDDYLVIEKFQYFGDFCDYIEKLLD